jgi:hypothetical protein
MANIPIPVIGIGSDSEGTFLLVKVSNDFITHISTSENYSTPFCILYRNYHYYISGNALVKYEEEWFNYLNKQSSVVFEEVA